MKQIKKVAVVGSGTMGRDIAQICAQYKFSCVLYDINADVLLKAKINIQEDLQKLVTKGKITSEESLGFFSNVFFTSDINNCKADLIIEAIVENIEIKKTLFDTIQKINTPDTIICSNTSSLSITQLSTCVDHPNRFAGLHFFNPATIMKLVEIVKGVHTDEDTILVLKEFVGAIHKSYVICQDSPGFIVNRIARHYYVESLKILEEQGATISDIDDLLESVGFKMGPFRLMDMIGNDINYSVTKSLYEAFDYDPKFRPSRIQLQKVLSGNLGRKSGQGFYNYHSK